MAFVEHPLRRLAVEEMQLRRFAPITPPSMLIQLVRMVGHHQRDAEAAMIGEAPGIALIRSAGGRHASGLTADGVRLIWERHSEASTATLIVQAGTGQSTAPLLRRWVEDLPGEVVRATRITAVASEADALSLLQSFEFNAEDLVSCHVSEGVRLWSDFKLREDDGYGQLLVAAKGVSPADLGRVVQAVQELGNYRNLALIGLPLVQGHRARLDQLEQLLARYAQNLTETGGKDEVLLRELTAVSAELALMGAETSFRLSATQAYASIAADRLARLQAQAVAGHLSLADFNDRRLLPAVRTCANFGERLTRLSERAAEITALLRTRIETSIERQNRDLLASVERGIGLQLRLQHLVEGLSVLAVSYYAIGLAGYLFKGMAGLGHGFGIEALLGALVLPVTIGIYLFIRNRRVELLAEKLGDED
jgi:uncharacterized membrane-anchored protein